MRTAFALTGLAIGFLVSTFAIASAEMICNEIGPTSDRHIVRVGSIAPASGISGGRGTHYLEVLDSGVRGGRLLKRDVGNAWLSHFVGYGFSGALYVFSPMDNDGTYVLYVPGTDRTAYKCE